MSQFDKLIKRIQSLDKNMRFEELQKFWGSTGIPWTVLQAEAAIRLFVSRDRPQLQFHSIIR